MAVARIYYGAQELLLGAAMAEKPAPDGTAHAVAEEYPGLAVPADIRSPGALPGMIGGGLQ